MTVEAPLWIQAKTYAARMDRHILDILFTEGVRSPGSPDNELKVVQRAAGANMSVDVGIGYAFVDGDDQVDQGTYLVHVTVLENLAVTAAPGSNSRIDLVVLQINDPNAGGAAGDNAQLKVIAGTVAASPVVPAVPASAIPLAEITVATGQTSIVTANITDRRTASSNPQLKIGTQLESMTAAARAALAGGALYDGRAVMESDTGKAYIYSTSLAVWVPVFHASLYRNFATTTIVNSTTETALATQSIPGGTFKVGDLVRLTAVGDMLNDTGSAKGVTMRLKFGATTLLSTNNLQTATNTNRRKWRVVVDLAIAGATEERAGALLTMSQAQPFTWEAGDFTNIIGAVIGYGTAAEAIASTLTLQLTAALDAAFSNYDIRCHHWTLERVGA